MNRFQIPAGKESTGAGAGAAGDGRSGVPKGPGKLPDRLQAAMARAEEAEAMYRSLVGQLPAITYTEAPDDERTLSVSPQVESLLGYTQEEWMANALLWVELLHPDDRDWVLEACTASERTGEPFRAEFRMMAKDGKIVWVRDEAILVRGSHGQPLCWQGVMLDITAQKEAEERLAEASTGRNALKP